MLLVVDDNPMFSKVIKEALTRRGVAHDIVTTGAEAVERVASQPGNYYSMLLVDVRLGDMFGDEVVRYIRSIDDPDRSSIPVVLMTGGEPVAPEVIASESICAVLYKPFLIGELMRIVGTCQRREPPLLSHPVDDFDSDPDYLIGDA